MDAAIKEYREVGYDAHRNYADYRTDGDYLRFGETKRFSESETVRFDQVGLPMVKYGEKFYYNPVTLAHFVLAEHGKLVNGDRSAKKLMVAGADRLLSIQDEDGAFRYNFEWTYYLSGETYEPGWVSGMAQGNGVSALVRAYGVTGRKTYLDAAQAAYDFLLIPIADGGTASTLAAIDPTLEDHIFFEEYVSDPGGFTLNGYIFALLGVFDLAETTGDPEVRETFDRGVDSLLELLPRYEVAGFTAYDLGHVTYGTEPHIAARYHAVHLFLLYAIESITGDPVLRKTLHKWESFIA